MDKTMSSALMADFSSEAIGHKPATWCRQCAEAVRARQGKSCKDHRVAWCPKCRTTITEAHTCLDFVGHADVRARLCEVDPEWSWAPFEFPGTGSLVLSADGQPVGLWIMLTVGGVSKPGYGSVDKGKTEAVKELIGDALRNAGQSFGIAWKLWAKGERTGGEHENATDAADDAAPANGNGNRGAAANGRTVRPANGNGEPAAPATGSEPDPDAQVYADEAQQARTLAVLKDVNTRAREAHKLASVIRDPATGKTGGLGQYIGWRKKQLEEDAAALAEFTKAITGMSTEAAEGHMRRICGTGIEDATAAQLRQAAQALTAGVSG